MCTVYGDGVIAEIIFRKWVARFRSGNFDKKDREHFGRPALVDDEQIETPTKDYPGYITRGIAEILHIYSL